MAILQQLRDRSVVRGQQEVAVLAPFPQSYTTGQTPQHWICWGNNNLHVKADGHSNARVKLSEHPSPLSGFLKLSQPI
jgi:hypothetical protein